MVLDPSPELRLAMKSDGISGMRHANKSLLFFFCFFCFSSGGHFVQQNKTILEILLEGHSRNISMKLFFK